MAWNTKYAGQPALAATDSRGYKHGRIFDKKHYAHRVVMALTTGEWPEEVDHINGVAADNRPENLRSVTHKENGRNIKRGTLNTSGALGVVFDRRQNTWSARIGVDMRSVFIGSFKTKEDAIAARKEAERRHGFHENHGRTA